MASPVQMEMIFRQAVQALNAGNLPAAEDGCRRMLALDKRCLPALQLMGSIALRRGEPKAAAGWFERMLKVAPNAFEGHANLAIALQALGRANEAVRHFQAALKLRGDIPGLHNDLGNALRAAKRFDEAARAYQAAIRLQPDFAEFHANLGQCRLDLGDLEGALGCFGHVLAAQPRHLRALAGAAVALAGLGRHDEAADRLETALAADAAFAPAWVNLAEVRRGQGRPVEAAQALGRAVELRPDAETLTAFAVALYRIGELDAAHQALTRAVAIAPKSFDAHLALGSVLHAAGRLDAAEDACRTALALQPGSAAAHHNLALVLADAGKREAAAAEFRRALKIQPDLAEARHELSNLRRHLCDWDGLDGEEAALLEQVRGGSGRVNPFFLLALDDATAADQRHAAEARVRRLGLDVLPPVPRPARPPGDRLRVGYLSADFTDHVVAHVVCDLLERHDRSRFEIVAYSAGPDDGSPIRARVAKAVDRFVDIGALSDEAAARCIASDGIDLLVDLGGHTGGARTGVLARRPAPVQVNWLGYAGTLGCAFMDAILVDAFSVPPAMQPHFAERLVHLPDTFFPHDPARLPAARVPGRAECGLPEQGFVFCAFAQSLKIRPAMFGLWMRLLGQVPGSVLWLRAAGAAAEANLRRAAAARGIDPARLVFAPKLASGAEHLARHACADLFVDTYPYGAHSTALDALWSGVPVLTLAGETFASRVAGGMLESLGLPELVAATPAEYEARALELAGDPARLAALKQRLAAARAAAPLFDADRFARSIEAAYEGLRPAATAPASPAA